jgi:hypothetical protein
VSVNGILNSTTVSPLKGINPPLSLTIPLEAKEQDSLNDKIVWEHAPDRSPGEEAGVYGPFKEREDAIKSLDQLEERISQFDVNGIYRETHEGDKIPEEKEEEGKEAEGEGVSKTGLTEEERKQVQELQRRDRIVRAHENAHRAAAGRYAGPIRYTYTTGPDGRRYVTGGSVAIDTSVPSDPEEAYQKAKVLQAAATAPGTNLSAADRRLLAAARRMAAEAARKMAQERMEKTNIGIESEDLPDTNAAIDSEAGVEDVRASNLEDEEKREVKEKEGQGLKINQLTEGEKKQLEKLKERDRKVRQHERAHYYAAGPYARGGPRYVYQRGPDGRMYAIGGSVVLDVSPIPGDPEATLRKAQVIRRAALAPMDPSPEDRRIALEASQMAMEARAELREERIKGDDEEEGAFKIEGLIQGKETEITPEIEREIKKKKRENPEMDEKDIREWLKRTKGVDVEEEEIRRILMDMEINQKREDFISDELINIYNRQNDALGEIIDRVA